MVRWVPVLTGVDTLPRQFKQAVDVRDDFQAAGHRQLGRAEGGKAPLRVDDEEGAGGRDHAAIVLGRTGGVSRRVKSPPDGRGTRLRIARRFACVTLRYSTDAARSGSG